MPIDTDFLTAGGAGRSPLMAELLGALVLNPGDRIGPYRILAEIGRGGMSVVYHAERADGAYDHNVALKVLRPDQRSQRGDELLRRERQILAKLDHPGIARVIDGGSTSDGSLWFAMERVVGEPIDKWCAARDLSDARCVDLFLDVCDAVQHAHSRLLIHRDIKPSNVLVDMGARVRLVDFGIAGMLSGAVADRSTRGALTPGVAAPEQERGDDETTATDIFQLGRLLTRLLQQRLGRSRELAGIVARATADDAANRYPTVAALAADVRAWRDGRPVSAYSNSSFYRLLRFARRHALAVALTLFGLTVLISTMVTSVWRIDTARRMAEQALAAAEQSGERAEQVSLFLVQTLSDAMPERLGRQPRVDDILAGAAERARTVLADQPALRGAVSATLAEIYINRMDFAAALPLLQDAVELAAAVPDMQPARRADLELRLAVALLSANELEQAGHWYQIALDRIAAAEPGGVRHRVTLRNLAQYYARRGDQRAALKLARQVMTLHRADPSTVPRDIASDMNNLAILEGLSGHHQAKAELARDACVLARQHGLASRPAGILACNTHGNALIETKRLAEAAAELSRVRIAAEEFYGTINTVTAGILSSVAGVEVAREQWSEAETHARDALQIYAQLPRANDTGSGATLMLLGDALFGQGRYAEALDVWRQLLAQSADGAHAIANDVGQYSVREAKALAALARCDEARATLVRVAELREKYPGSGPPELDAEIRRVAISCSVEGRAVRAGS